MNEALNNIMTRRSIRSFTDRKIERADLEAIAAAAVYAPSACNFQTWRITVIQKPELIDKLAKAIAVQTGSSDYNFYKPNTVILASNERTSPFGAEDCSCALENIFLAAHALGIGSVWINQLRGICDEPAVRVVLDELGLPESQIVYGTAALGYAAAPGRKPNKNMSNINYFI
ncbi:MAG: nitroreductase family protein [Eubacteriales bacterium]